MRILYDGYIYGIAPYGGISRYFYNIISRLPKQDVPLLTTCVSTLNYPSHPNIEIFKWQRFKPRRFSCWLEKYYFTSIAAFKLNNFDIIHPTYYSLLSQQEISEYTCPIVLTVHDMIHEIFSQQMDFKGQQAEEKRKAIYAAQVIICVSENTKKDLLERHSLPEDKVKVTYLASGINASMASGTEPVPSRPYYLYVGSRASAYKNFDGLLLAFAKAVSVQPDIALCVVGSPFNRTEKKMIAELKLGDRIEHYSNANDTHLAKLYSCSIALVYPSLYEGFGIPPLEAMSCGTATIAANCSSIPEVVGDASILFNPRATHDLADILLFLLNNSLERDRLIVRGYQRAKLFSWDKTVKQTLEIYESSIN